jgi:hypothetical protein
VKLNNRAEGSLIGSSIASTNDSHLSRELVRNTSGSRVFSSTNAVFEFKSVQGAARSAAPQIGVLQRVSEDYSHSCVENRPRNWL